MGVTQWVWTVLAPEESWINKREERKQSCGHGIKFGVSLELFQSGVPLGRGEWESMHLEQDPRLEEEHCGRWAFPKQWGGWGEEWFKGAPKGLCEKGRGNTWLEVSAQGGMEDKREIKEQKHRDTWEKTWGLFVFYSTLLFLQTKRERWIVTRW